MWTREQLDDVERAAHLRDWLHLQLLPGVGAQTLRRWLATWGSAQAVLAQSPEALAQQLGPSRQDAAQAVWTPATQAAVAAQWAKTQAWLRAAANRAIVCMHDAAYPQALLELKDPPLLLHLMGEELLRHEKSHWWRQKALALVGSRNPSAYGRDNAQRFAQSLCQAGWVVVSGMAWGVDAAAHEGALLAGGPTWAVVGTGLDRVYPQGHAALARAIATQGLVISEYLLGTAPLSHHFPQRNRLIAGLCAGVLVVEAAPQSGSLITARLGAEMGREVFAIPGSIHAAQSKGCHSLLREGAKLVESVQDVLEELGSWGGACAAWADSGTGSATAIEPITRGKDRTPRHSVSAEQLAHPVLQAMGAQALSFDAIQERCGIDTAGLQAQLLELELLGWVKTRPGALYQITEPASHP